MAGPQLQLSPEQQQDLANLAFTLGHHPKTRGMIAQAVKEIDERRYNTSFRDIAEQQRFEAYRKDLEEKLDVSGARAEKARQDAAKVKLTERYGESQMAGIEATMTKYGMKDWDAAATLYAAQNGDSDPTLRPPRPDPRRDATWEFPTVEDQNGKPMGFKEFANDLRGASMNAAYRTIDELNAFKNRTLSPAFHR
jgi:hypothetical protein